METKIQLRPCIVNNEKRALFHKWEHCSEIIPPSPLAGGHNGGVLEYDVAIVEYEDGTIREVMPKYIRFVREEETN